MASYIPLEPSNLGSLGVAAPSFSGSAGSFFASTTFIYTLLFMAIILVGFGKAVQAGILMVVATSKEDFDKAKKILTRIAWTFLGVFSIPLILMAINKDLLIGDVGFGALAARKGEARGGGGQTTIPITTPGAPAPFIPRNNDDPAGWGAIQNDPVVRQDLKNSAITVNKKVCVTPTQTSCTTVGGLPSDTISMLKQLRVACGGNIAITGGTEAGHSSHGPNKYPVDLSLNDSTLASCIRSFPVGPAKSFCKKTYSKFGYIFCDEVGTPHWHVYK